MNMGQNYTSDFLQSMMIANSKPLTYGYPAQQQKLGKKEIMTSARFCYNKIIIKMLGI